ncbi:MAG: threonine ammonia-lyase [Candidatus Hodarchaeales archaeon]|jgi:threonine dehydratase
MSSIFKGLTLWEVKETLQQIRPYVKETPLVRAYNLEELLDVEVYLKLELLHPTNSFKIRGACSKALSIDKNLLSNGLVTASGGNHGLGVCYAGKELDVPVTVFLPTTTVKEKVTKIKQWGGRAILYGEAWDEANIKAQEFSEEEKLTFIHPFDDLAVVKGQGTIALEILNQEPYMDAIVGSVGGGGLISGVGVVANQMKPEIKIFGVETEGCDAVTQSFRAGYPITLPTITSIADTLGAKRTTEITLSRIKAVVNDMQTVTDDEALDALQILLEKEKMLVEPATSCSLAALLQNKFDLSKIEKICLILCGANVSLRQLREWKVI